MDSVKAERSMFFGGDWHDALWCAEVVNEATGELSVMATAADLGDGKRLPPVVVMRMTMALVRELRALAGFRQAQPELRQAQPELRQAQPAEAAEGIPQRMGTANEEKIAALERADIAILEAVEDGMVKLNGRVAALEGILQPPGFGTANDPCEALPEISDAAINDLWSGLVRMAQQLAKEALDGTTPDGVADLSLTPALSRGERGADETGEGGGGG